MHKASEATKFIWLFPSRAFGPEGAMNNCFVVDWGWVAFGQVNSEELIVKGEEWVACFVFLRRSRLTLGHL